MGGRGSAAAPSARYLLNCRSATNVSRRAVISRLVSVTPLQPSSLENLLQEQAKFQGERPNLASMAYATASWSAGEA